MEEQPERKLRISSFAAHAARGVIRDQKIRRNTMFVLLLVALILLFSGSTFLQTMLNPREHPVGFILFWFVCIWLTCTAFLLAIFDILLVRAQRRKLQKILRSGLVPDADSSTIRKD
jgi:hypothetical protein